MDQIIEGVTRKEIVDLCTAFLEKPWNTATEGEIEIHFLSHGFGNRNFRCAYKGKNRDGTFPNMVVVHLFGSQLLDFDPIIKLNGEAAESVVEWILSRMGMGPKILAIFPGGRIEEYVPSTCLAMHGVNDTQILLKIAEKLAKFHTLKMPISKTTNRLQKYIEMMDVMLARKQTSGNAVFFRETPFAKEYAWYDEIIRKVSGKPVLVHGDLNSNNILVIDRSDAEDKDVMLIDYELCSYYFRGFDIGYLFFMMKCKLERADEKVQISIASGQLDRVVELAFLKTYLDETKKFNGGHFCPAHDSLENLQLEVDLSAVVVEAMLQAGAVLFPEKMGIASQNSLQSLGIEYETRKKQILERYNNGMSQSAYSKCLCGN